MRGRGRRENRGGGGRGGGEEEDMREGEQVSEVRKYGQDGEGTPSLCSHKINLPLVLGMGKVVHTYNTNQHTFAYKKVNITETQGLFH